MLSKSGSEIGRKNNIGRVECGRPWVKDDGSN